MGTKDICSDEWYWIVGLWKTLTNWWNHLKGSNSECIVPRKVLKIVGFKYQKYSEKWEKVAVLVQVEVKTPVSYLDPPNETKIWHQNFSRGSSCYFEKELDIHRFIH